MMRSRRRNERLPRTREVALSRRARVLSSSDSMRGTFTPQLRNLSSYCTSRPLSVSERMSSSRARSGVGAFDDGGRLTTLFLSRTMSTMPLIDDEVIDREAAAEDAPRQRDFDAAGDQERAVLMALRREAHVGQRNAAGDRVVAEVPRLEFEVVARAGSSRPTRARGRAPSACARRRPRPGSGRRQSPPGSSARAEPSTLTIRF